MKITVTTLKLPKPSDTLIQMFNDHVSKFEYQDYARGKPNSFYDNLYDTAVHISKKSNDLPDELISQVKSEYQEFFTHHTVTAQVDVSKQHGNSPSNCEPPSCARHNRFAITFFIDAGGNDTSTVFYNRIKTNYNDVSAMDLKYSEVTEVCRANLTSNNWNCYPTDWAHSVENITGKRSLLTIRFDPNDSNYSLDSFMNDYPELIDQILIDKQMVTNDNGVIVAQN